MPEIIESGATWPQSRLDAVAKRKRIVLAGNRTTVARSAVSDLVSIQTEISRLPSPVSLVYGSVIIKRLTLTDIWGGLYWTRRAACTVASLCNMAL